MSNPRWRLPGWRRRKLVAKIGACQRCDIKSINSELQVHHIVPRCLGGGNAISNLRVLCPTCHKIEDALNGSNIHIKSANQLASWKDDIQPL